ncbi:hypothetical protein RAA17_23025 [Komagataeibacter rhaeticus]|nr:hypothetical protein [Komagataeibacter rhaeticus]
MEHDRCRQRALTALEADGLLATAALRDLDQRLAALEADITANI